MQNITLSADEELIERARLRARSEKTTLNAVFRDWLSHYAGVTASAGEYGQLMRRLAHVRAPRSFQRDELNSR